MFKCNQIKWVAVVVLCAFAGPVFGQAIPNGLLGTKPDGVTPEFKSIVPGPGITITNSPGAITISAPNGPPPVPTVTGPTVYAINIPGFDCTGRQDMSGLLSAALLSFPFSGGRVSLEGCSVVRIDNPIDIGNGSSAAYSTVMNVTLSGTSGHNLTSPNAPPPTQIIAKSAMPSLIRINGPAGGIRIEHLLLNAAGLADTGIDSVGAEGLQIEDVRVIEQRRFGIKIDHRVPYSGPPLFGLSTKPALRHVLVNSNQSGSGGLQVGATGTIAQLYVENSAFTCFGGNNTGIELRNTDHDVFISTITNVQRNTGSTGLRIKPVAGASVFPHGHAFYDCALVGDVSIDESEAPWQPGTRGIFFNPYPTSDGQSVPTDPRFWGVDDQKRLFGGWTVSDMMFFSDSTENPTLAELTGRAAFYRRNGRAIIAFAIGGVPVYLSAPLTSSSGIATWTYSTTAP